MVGFEAGMKVTGQMEVLDYTVNYAIQQANQAMSSTVAQ